MATGDYCRECRTRHAIGHLPVARCGKADLHGAHRTSDHPYWCAGNKGTILTEQTADAAQYAAYRADVASDHAEIAFSDVKGSLES